MNYEIRKAIKKHVNEEELYLVTCVFVDQEGLVGTTWFLYPDEDTARGMIDACNMAYESACEDFEVITDEDRKVVIEYGDPRITITYKIRKVK